VNGQIDSGFKPLVMFIPVCVFLITGTNNSDPPSNIQNTKDEGRTVDVVYMDFSKVFDKVPHGRLMQKVGRHGIEGNLAVWIRNWLAY